jgi:hypothetical protein
MSLLDRVAEVLHSLRWSDLKPSEGIVIEDQIGVLRAIAHSPGSIIKDEEPHRAGKPLRYRTIQRLLKLEQLTNGLDDRGIGYITLTAEGWDRIVVVDVDKQ